MNCLDQKPRNHLWSPPLFCPFLFFILYSISSLYLPYPKHILNLSTPSSKPPGFCNNLLTGTPMFILLSPWSNLHIAVGVFFLKETMWLPWWKSHQNEVHIPFQCFQDPTQWGPHPTLQHSLPQLCPSFAILGPSSVSPSPEDHFYPRDFGCSGPCSQNNLPLDLVALASWSSTGSPHRCYLLKVITLSC